MGSTGSLSVLVSFDGRVLSVSGNYKKSSSNIFNFNKESFIELCVNKFGLQEVYHSETIIYNQNNQDCLACIINCKKAMRLNCIVKSFDLRSFFFKNVVLFEK